MEHDPLGRGGDALMALVERRQLREHGIVRVGHGGRTIRCGECGTAERRDGLLVAGYLGRSAGRQVWVWWRVFCALVVVFGVLG